MDKLNIDDLINSTKKHLNKIKTFITVTVAVAAAIVSGFIIAIGASDQNILVIFFGCMLTVVVLILCFVILKTNYNEKSKLKRLNDAKNDEKQKIIIEEIVNQPTQKVKKKYLGLLFVSIPALIGVVASMAYFASCQDTKMNFWLLPLSYVAVFLLGINFYFISYKTEIKKSGVVVHRIFDVNLICSFEELKTADIGKQRDYFFEDKERASHSGELYLFSLPIEGKIMRKREEGETGVHYFNFLVSALDKYVYNHRLAFNLLFFAVCCVFCAIELYLATAERNIIFLIFLQFIFVIWQDGILNRIRYPSIPFLLVRVILLFAGNHTSSTTKKVAVFFVWTFYIVYTVLLLVIIL